MTCPYREPAAAVNLAVCGVPDGDPGPAVAPRYREFRGRDLLVCQGQRVDPGKLALFDAADMLRGEMRNPYPWYGWIQYASKSMRASLRCWLENNPPGARIYSGVVAGSCILAYLARAFVEAFAEAGLLFCMGRLQVPSATAFSSSGDSDWS